MQQTTCTIADGLRAHGVSSLWHMTHRNNIGGIVRHGLLSHDAARQQGLLSVDISDPDVQHWRTRAEDCYGRSLHAYAPLYINPRNAMLFVRQGQRCELCIIEIDLAVLDHASCIVTDGNAASRDTAFYTDAACVDKLPWDVLSADRWNGFCDGKRKRCAEVLVHPCIEPEYIKAIHCHTVATQAYIALRHRNVQRTTALFF